MEVTMKNSDVRTLFAICRKLRNGEDKVVLWKVTDRRLAVERALEPLNEVAELPERIKEFQAKHRRIMESHGTPGKTLPQADGSIITLYDMESEEGKTLLRDLKEEYQEDLDAEPEREVQINEVLRQEVTFDFEPFEFEWLDNSINGDDIAFLRRFELVQPPKEAKRPKKPSKKPKKRR